MSNTPTLSHVTVPWRVVPVVDGEKHWLAIIDPERTEICRVFAGGDDTQLSTAMAVANMVTALPWLLMAAKRTTEDLDQMEVLKNGVTVRQWVRNHEGYRRRIELRDAVHRALKESTGEPPVSYGIRS